MSSLLSECTCEAFVCASLAASVNSDNISDRISERAVSRTSSELRVFAEVVVVVVDGFVEVAGCCGCCCCCCWFGCASAAFALGRGAVHCAEVWCFDPQLKHLPSEALRLRCQLVQLAPNRHPTSESKKRQAVLPFGASFLPPPFPHLPAHLVVPGAPAPLPPPPAGGLPPDGLPFPGQLR